MKSKSFPFAFAFAFALLLLSGASFVQAQQQTPRAPSAAGQDAPERRISIFMNGGNFLGVRTEDVTRENMSRLGLSEMRGAIVNDVVQGGPAERAGLKKDDVIVRFDGETITSARKLTRLIEEAAPESVVRLTIRRGGAEQELTATLGKRESFASSGFGNSANIARLRSLAPQTEELRRRLENLNRDGNGDFLIFNSGASRRIGVTTQPLTKQLADYFGVASGEGLLITSVTENSPAAKAGLRAGDVITEADGDKVRSAVDLARIVSRKTDGEVSLTVVREKQNRTVRVVPERRSNTNGEFRFDFAPQFQSFAPDASAQ